MKRFVFAVLAVLIAGSVLAGCSGDSGGGTPGAKDTPEQAAQRKDKAGDK